MWKYGEKGDKSCPQPMERAGKVKKEFFCAAKIRCYNRGRENTSKIFFQPVQ